MAVDYNFVSDNYTQDDDLSIAEIKRREAMRALSQMAKERWVSSVAFKTEITNDIAECRRAMAGTPIKNVHVDPDLPLVLNVAAAIGEGLLAMFTDSINVSADNMVTLTSTPSPTLPPEQAERILTALTEQQQAMAMMGMPPSLDDMADAVRGLDAAVRKEMKHAADVAARELQTVVQDKLLEGGMRQALTLALADYVSSMAMVLKAPATKFEHIREWKEGRVRFTQRLTEGVERIDPDNFFLAPGGALTPQKAEWVFERRRVQPSELVALASDPNYNGDEIMRVFRQHPGGWIEQEGGVFSCMQPDQSTAYTRSFAYDALVMHGLIKGSLLEDMGLKVGDKDLSYEAEIITISDCVIASMVNTDAMGRRPYYMDSFYASPTTPWGGSPVSRLRDIQRVITSLFISMAGDSALAGLHIELDPTMLHGDDKLSKDAVRPRMVRMVKSAVTAQGRQRAYNIFPVQTQVAAFMQEINNLMALAYEITGVPRLAFGQTAGAGTLGRTAGGVASVMNQATKGIRAALIRLEQNVIEPVAQAFVDRELVFNPPKHFTGDIKATARGLSGLVEKAEEATNMEWAVATLIPHVDKVGPDGQLIFPADAIQRLLFKLFKARGVATEGIFNTNYDTADALAGITPQPGMQSATVGPALDAARSPQAAAAISASNDPAGVRV